MSDDPPLTVALPTSSFLPDLGGVAVGLHNIAARLEARGHRPLVLAPYGLTRRLGREGWRLPYRIAGLPPRAGWLMDRAPWPSLVLMDRTFGRLQRRHGFDFWHATVGYPTGVWMAHFARRWARRTGRGLPHLIRCAGDDVQLVPEIGYGMRSDPAVDRLLRRWLPRADCLVAITETMAEEYRALGVSERRIAHVPNGVDLERFAAPVDRAALRRRLGLDPDAFLYLAVGRNHPKKNFLHILRALAAQPRGAGDRAVLMVVGEGAGRLAPLAAGLGLARRVVLREAIAGAPVARQAVLLPPPALVELYRAADAFVFPSRVESFGIVLVEAMAAGLPVIAGDAPGCRDVLRQGRDGILVPPDDPAALEAAMTRVRDDAGLRRDLAARSLARARDFSWDTVVDRYLAVYREGIARARRGFGDAG